MKRDILADDKAFYLLGEHPQGVSVLSYKDYLDSKKSESCPSSLRKYFTYLVTSYRWPGTKMDASHARIFCTLYSAQ